MRVCGDDIGAICLVFLDYDDQSFWLTLISINSCVFFSFIVLVRGRKRNYLQALEAHSIYGYALHVLQ